MNPIDLATFCAFFVAIVVGVMVLLVTDMNAKRAKHRIAQRMRETFATDLDSTDSAAGVESLLMHVDGRRGVLSKWIDPVLRRLRTVSGGRGIRVVLLAAATGALASVSASRFLPLPMLVKPFVAVGLPVFAVWRTYKFLVDRFRLRFLDAFPDAIDLIVRAVRAGVPVTHVLGTVAQECPEPLAGEFRLMGDYLRVGRDLSDVLSVAMERIRLADFSFFCVCLLLQRETGGQLGETLENLAAIVRTRREIRQKTKALTAEARVTTKILAAIPIVIMASMYALNPNYLVILLHREAGHKLLTFAAISVVVGIAVIGKMAKLDTAR
jgi:Flp pilus assembly protein TadB